MTARPVVSSPPVSPVEGLAAELGQLDEAVRQLMRASEVLRGMVERVRELHHEIPAGKPDAGFCDGCESSWPCPTIRALDGAS